MKGEIKLNEMRNERRIKKEVTVAVREGKGREKCMS